MQGIKTLPRILFCLIVSQLVQTLPAASGLTAKAANSIDGGVNFLLHQATWPKSVTTRTKRGRQSLVPTSNHQTAHGALIVLGLVSAGYETGDHTAEGFALREATELLLSPVRQRADGYWGSKDRSLMYGHGLTLFALSELLQTGSVMGNRQLATRKAVAGGRFSILNQSKGVWAALPATMGGGVPGTLVSALQVMGLKSLSNLGYGDSRASLYLADRVFETCVFQGGHHFNGSFRKGGPLPVSTTGGVVGCITRVDVRQFHSFNETAAGAVASMALGTSGRLSFMERLAGLHGIAGRYGNGLMPLQFERSGVVGRSYRRAYHGLGTMLFAWALSGSSDFSRTDIWIARTVTDAQFANGTWSTYGDSVAPALNGVVPSTAYAVLSLTACDRRLPILSQNGHLSGRKR